MSIVQIPANPTREDLRAAHTVLKGLAAAGIPGAKDEQTAVSRLMRVKYPRKPIGRKRPKRRAIIEAQDAMVTCHACLGSGSADKEGRSVCYRCGGIGLEECPPEHDPMDTHYAGVLPRGDKPLRGDFAQQFGCSSAEPISPAPHSRGFINGKTVHKDSPEVATLFHRRAGPIDDVDISAGLEGIAIARMWGEPSTPDKGRRLLSPQRDRLTVIAGENRSMMFRRVRWYQTLWNRAHRRGSPAFNRMPNKAVCDALRLVGIDPKAWWEAMKADPPVARKDSPRISEARRRADLPPDDDVPEWDDALAITLDDGRRVIVEPSNGTHPTPPTRVYRPDTQSVEWADRPVRVREKDGSPDLLHPADVPA